MICVPNELHVDWYTSQTCLTRIFKRAEELGELNRIRWLGRKAGTQTGTRKQTRDGITDWTKNTFKKESSIILDDQDHLVEFQSE